MGEKVFYISDLDGTLLRSDASLSSYSKSCLNEMIADGLQFTVASARSVVSMRTILDGLEINLPIIEFNGAFISDLKTGHHEVINKIDRGRVEAIYHLINSRGYFPFISTYNGEQDCLYFSEITNEGMDWYYKNRVLHNDPRFYGIGYGTKLWHEARRHLRAEKFYEITLWVLDANERARKLYEKIGFSLDEGVAIEMDWMNGARELRYRYRIDPGE